MERKQKERRKNIGERRKETEIGKENSGAWLGENSETDVDGSSE